MGQVPQSTLNSILIIGNGRAAKHLNYYFTHLGYAIINWHYKANSHSELINYFEKCNYCLLLIKDDALETFIQKYNFLKSNKTFHCSGSLTIEGLRCIHPLMTFGNNLYDIDFYKKIHWAIFEESRNLKDYLPLLPNNYFYVRPEQKTFYHAMCVMSGNFTQLLLQQVLLQWQNQLNLTSDPLVPFLNKSVENFWFSGASALTGPLARKDFGTIGKHLASLQQGPQYELYLAFLKLYLSEQEFNNFKINSEASPRISSN